MKFIFMFKMKMCERGQILAQEGTFADKVWLVVDGEVEIVKQNLAKVWYNEKTAVVGLKEVKTNIEGVKSEKMLRSTASDIIKVQTQ